MAIVDEVLPASYKEVPFLLLSTNTPASVKHVKHRFPNSSNQVIEELGLQQRTYNVDAIISSDRLGEGYLERRDQLLRVLEEGGVGVLVHPFYGILDNIKAVSWVPIEDFTRLGEFRISIVFEVDTGQVVPVATDNTISIINQSNNNVVAELGDDISENYSITTTFTENFLDAIVQGNGIIDAFNENTSFLAVAADQIDIFTNEISNFSTNLTTLIQNPQNLADSLLNLFETVNGLYPTVTSTFTVFKEFFDFGDNDPEIPETTVIRIERKNNRDILRSTMQMTALSYAYLNASQIEFPNVTEIMETADELEEQYQKVVGLGGLTDTAISALTDMRVEVQQFFREQRLTADQIISINTVETSTRLVAYQYYGNTDNADVIKDLNSLTDISFISGDLDTVTA